MMEEQTYLLLQRYRQDRRNLLEFLFSSSLIKELRTPAGHVTSLSDLDFDNLSADYILHSIKSGGVVDISEATKKYFNESSYPVMEGSAPFEMLQKYPYLVKYANNHSQEVLHVTPHSMSKIQSLKLSKEFKIHHLHCFNFDEEQLIGHGSFGKVYQGWMWGLKNSIIESKPIAVKVSENRKPDKLGQFKAETHLCSSLQHENIVKILGHCEDEKLYIVYEYMKKGNLGQCYQDLDWPKTIKIAQGIALAVEYMHNLDPPLTNRDLKLNNILLDEELNPKVSDFGMVTKEGDAKSINGTLGFQDWTIKKTGVATRKTDMHNVGVILLLLITKQPYFDRQDYIGNRAMKQFKEGKEHGIAVHETLKDTGCNEDNAILIIKTALKCIDDCLDARPSIGQVVQILRDL